MSLCEGCHAGCCRAFAAPVTGADIIRIQQDLNLSFWDFVCRWEDADGTISGNHAPQIYFSDEPETPFVICLSHVPSAFTKESHKCRFLIESQPDAEHPLGVARCGIYHSRPSTCRAFPTKLNQTGELAILYELPEKETTEEKSVYDLCPEQWKPEQINSIDAVQNLVVARYEMNFFTQLVETWNHTPQPWEFFPDFLQMVYSQRVQTELAVDEKINNHQNKDEEPNLIPFPVVEETQERRRAA